MNNLKKAIRINKPNYLKEKTLRNNNQKLDLLKTKKKLRLDKKYNYRSKLNLKFFKDRQLKIL
jgi:hypothetical protein